MIKSKRGLEEMFEILNKLEGEQSKENEQLEIQIYHAFGFYGNLTIKEKALEQFLIDVLEKKGIKHLFGIFQKTLFRMIY